MAEGSPFGGLESFYLALFTRLLKWASEEIEIRLGKVHSALSK